VRERLSRVLDRLAVATTPRSDAEAASEREANFVAACAPLERPRVLELGAKRSRPERSTLHRDWVPHAAEFLGTDFEAGVDVDVVADLHSLSETVGEESFDVIISCSTFEHLKYPTLAAHEILKALTVGGLLYVQTHQTFPLHAYPSDYFRFSSEALRALFGTRMGFETAAAGHDFPARVHARRVPDARREEAYLNSTLWGTKRAQTPAEYVYEL
jgi:hypothetical protein